MLLLGEGVIGDGLVLASTFFTGLDDPKDVLAGFLLGLIFSVMTGTAFGVGQFGNCRQFVYFSKVAGMAARQCLVDRFGGSGGRLG